MAKTETGSSTQGTTIYRKDYQEPTHWIRKTDMVFELDEQATRVEATSRIESNPKNPSDTLRLNGTHQKLISVAINDEVIREDAYILDDTGLTLKNLPENFTLTIVSENNPSANKALEGLYVSNGKFCTQCEAEGFRRITYFLDRPDVLSVYTVTIRGDQSKYPYLLSNGNPGPTQELDDGRHEAIWIDPHPKPSYLFALVAGNLARVEDSFTTMSGKEVGLHVYVEHPNVDQVPHCMTSLKNSMKWDEERFGREFDLDLYQIVAVSDFNMGAMENKGLNIFNTKYVLAKAETATDKDFLGVEAVVGHEYFHNWSGNRVTCRDWFQLSLKEGFTVYRDQEFSSDLNDRAIQRIQDVRLLRAGQFPEDAGPMAHSIRPDSYQEISNFYTRTVYEKGAEVVRMIETLLGRESFRKGCDLYFNRHDGSAATCEDFVKAMEDASGKDLKRFRRWYRQAGTPSLHIEPQYDASRGKLVLNVRQSTGRTPGQSQKEPFVIPLRVKLFDETGSALSEETLLVLEDESACFELECTNANAVVSINRGFSAPIYLSMNEAPGHALVRMKHDDDLFNRWDACQQLAEDAVLEAYHAKSTEAQDAFIQAYETLILDATKEPAFVGEALRLPSFNVLAERLDAVRPTQLHQARESILDRIATTYNDKILKAFAELPKFDSYEVSNAQVGVRSCKGALLILLSRLESNQALIEEEYRNANNMTERLSALALIADSDMEKRTSILDAFAEEWKDQALVMDKWFAVQASSTSRPVLKDVDVLLEHKSFDLKNPNKVRSLIGTFAAANPAGFHAQDGSGYKFLGRYVEELNAFNPQIASRLCSPLLKWKNFDEEAGSKMKNELKRLVELDLSKDVYEVVSKALNA